MVTCTLTSNPAVLPPLKLSAKGQAYLDRHFAERELQAFARSEATATSTEGGPLILTTEEPPQAPTNGSGKTPIAAESLSRFEFASLEDVDDSQWREMYSLLLAHTKQLIADYRAGGLDSHDVCLRVITRIKSGKCGWLRENQPNLLLHMVNVIRGMVKVKRRTQRPVIVERSSKELLQAIEFMDVSGVIEHLPVMALLVGRLNDLLKPVANPVGPPTVSVAGRVQ